MSKVPDFGLIPRRRSIELGCSVPTEISVGLPETSLIEKVERWLSEHPYVESAFSVRIDTETADGAITFTVRDPTGVREVFKIAIWKGMSLQDCEEAVSDWNVLFGDFFIRDQVFEYTRSQLKDDLYHLAVQEEPLEPENLMELPVEITDLMLKTFVDEAFLDMPARQPAPRKRPTEDENTEMVRAFEEGLAESRKLHEQNRERKKRRHGSTM
ncbi:hypothetical protein AAF712_005672 [Marasmius tenuissimus]|uniref:Uncharacterized protein n=1 Tax=Marasmius tenuissimus TaxID=585030 RepID=A0ABR2ZZZ3_9AGAR